MGKEYIARNLSEYISIVKEVTKEIKEINSRYEVWFRGQEDCNYQLTPKGLRSIRNKTVCQYMRQNEDVDVAELNMLLQKFKRKSVNNLGIIPSSEIEWLIIAQHYGLATKLLDWTTNALIGLYFSLPDKKTLDNMYDISLEDMIEVMEDNCLTVDEIKNMSKKEVYDLKHYPTYIEELNQYQLNNRNIEDAAAVYIMSPNILNKCTIIEDTPVYVHGEDIEKDMEYFIHANSQNNSILLESIGENATNELPICIVCNEVDKRIRNQSGCFTIHGYYCAPLDFYTALEKEIHKVYIPYDSVELIRDELKECGIDKYFVYQDLNSLSDELNNEEFRIFNGHKAN
ncbi:MAG: FRG domain-containing protein [Clostridium sp.]